MQPARIAWGLEAQGDTYNAPHPKTDAELAFDLQLAESAWASKEPPPSPPEVSAWCWSDPVWGDFLIPGARPSVFDMACIMCCPCLVLRCHTWSLSTCRGSQTRSAQEIQHAWWRFLFSGATALIGGYGVLLICAIALNGGIAPLAQNPMLGPSVCTMDVLGGKNAAHVLYSGQWWRLAASPCLHSGLVHYAVNAAVQLRLGVHLESLWGHSAWLCLYAASGMYSMLLSCALLPDVMGVGASGALCGLMGAWLCDAFVDLNPLQAWRSLHNKARLLCIAMLLLTTGLASLLPGVDAAAHWGGALAGGLLSPLVWAHRLSANRRRVVARLTGALSFSGLVAATTTYFVHAVRPDPTLLDIRQNFAC